MELGKCMSASWCLNYPDLPTHFGIIAYHCARSRISVRQRILYNIPENNSRKKKKKQTFSTTHIHKSISSSPRASCNFKKRVNFLTLLFHTSTFS